MTQGELARDLPACGGQADMAVRLHTNQAIFFQASQRHGDGRRRNRKPVGEGGRDDGLAFAFSFQYCLEVVFFRDGDHLSHIIGRRLSVVNRKSTTETRSHGENEFLRRFEICAKYQQVGHSEIWNPLLSSVPPW